MHIGARTSHKGAPTAHCAYSRSGESLNLMKYNNKDTCLFFDQVNNYSKFCCCNPMTWLPSTDLSTVIVDKWVSGRSERVYARGIAPPPSTGYYTRPDLRRRPHGRAYSGESRRGDAHPLRAHRFCRYFYRGSYESRYPSRI